MNTEPHFHENEQGLLIRCYKHCTNLITDWRFWVGMTIGYPFEHFLWEHVWPFYLIMNLM